jgi:hypothetical protein
MRGERRFSVRREPRSPEATLHQDTLESAAADRDALRREVESLRVRLKAAEHEVQRLADQTADAERRAQFAQEVLVEERRQAERERINLEKLIKALGGPLEESPARPEPAPAPSAPARNGASAGGEGEPVAAEQDAPAEDAATDAADPEGVSDDVAAKPALPPREPVQPAPEGALGATQPGDALNSFPLEEPEEGAIAAVDRPSALRRLIGRRRQPEPATASPRKCSVCGRRAQRKDDEAIRAEGWIVSAKVAVCDGCRAEGWELEDEARLPFRRAPQKEAR